jgi:uncharacterized membrane protein
MSVIIRGVNNVQELSEKIDRVCQNTKIKKNTLIVTYINKKFVIERDETADNEFYVSIAMSALIQILIPVFVMLLILIIERPGFISIFLLIIVALRIIFHLKYETITAEEFKQFVALLEAAGNKETEKSKTDVSLQKMERGRVSQCTTKRDKM